jgi:CHAT domain-containing protein
LELSRQLGEAEVVTRQFLVKLREQFTPRSAEDERAFELAKTSAMQGTLRQFGPNTVALFTLVAEKRIVTMLVTEGARKVYQYPIERKEVNRKMAELRRALENPARDPVPLAQNAYQMIFSEKLREDLDRIGVQTILWSLDGTLRYVPVTALHDGERYLGQVYRHALMTPESRESLQREVPAEWEGVGFGATRGGAGFTPLPAVRGELEGIFKQQREAPQPVLGKAFLDEGFTEESFLQPGRRVNSVHVASHFDSRPGDAENSKLLLGNGKTLSMLELAKSSRLFDDVSLLTLSACQTGLANKGDEDGREVDSLANIGQQLGAHAVLASLWNVNDQSTALFMREFYRVRQAEGLTKAEAIRRTQAAFIEGKIQGKGCAGRFPGNVPAAAPGYQCEEARPYAHPYYWAPFVLMGNFR